MKPSGYGATHWIYPADQTPPLGAPLILLTRGGTHALGQWINNGDYLAWQNLFVRDRSKEV